MQVDNNGSISSLIQSTKEGQTTQDTQSAAHQSQPQNSQQTGQKDTVTFTQAAAQLQQIEQYIKSAPVTDTQRIEQVKSAIETGNYNPNTAQVANKMLNFESVLNSNRSRAQS